MKIGILTFHRALNYGAVLQCNALYTTLKSMGHEPEIIDYRPESIERYRHLYSKLSLAHDRSIIQKIKSLIVGVITTKGRSKSSKKFDDFINTYFKISKPFNYPIEELSGYDAIIFGSDQIWSPSICFGFDKMYWGQFKHKKTKLITYAASLGGHNILSEADLNVIKQYIKSYDSVSIREKELHDMLKDKIGIECPIVVDPTILVNSNVFDRISVKPKCENYVLLFTLEPNEQAYDFAKRIADINASQIVTLRALPSYKKNKNKAIHAEAISVEEFLGYFKYARYIVAISFHGTVFSVLFKKDFYSLKCSQGDRAYNFLSSIGLENRMVGSDQIVDANSINYNGVDVKLQKLRESSIDFLREALSTESINKDKNYNIVKYI